MQFIYLGEVTFTMDRMDEFLAVAKLLEIKELHNATGTHHQPIKSNQPQHKPSSSIDSETIAENSKEETKISDSDHCLKEQAVLERKIEVNSDNDRFECEPCQKSFSKMGLYYHNNSVHQSDRYVCDQCDYQAKTPYRLTQHIQSKHEGIRYTCDQCDNPCAKSFSQRVCITTKNQSIRVLSMLVISVTIKLHNKLT